MQQKKNKKKSGRKKGMYEVLYGAHAITEMLKAKKRKLISLYTTKPLPRAWQRIKPYLPKAIPNIQYVTRNVLSSMAKSHEHMGIVALVAPFPFSRTLPTPEKHQFILLLDGIQDVGNLGGILRSAYCTGVDAVVATTKGSASFTAAVFKASAGLAEHLRINRISSLKGTVLDLKKAGYCFYLTVLEGGKNALEISYKKPMCLVIGNEAVGISKDIRGEGELITLPQRSADISYNASVAAGIFMFLMGFGGIKKI
jgi:23S rRNA (guanosine2251-2'-O)-methyltransferase